MAVRLLILGGTKQARELADHLHAVGYDGIYSLAGVTSSPRLPAMPHRVGGFGGQSGFERFLVEEAITHIIDATHAFAKKMRETAWHIAQNLAIPLFRFDRPKWQAQPHDHWVACADLKTALGHLADGAFRHAFLALGVKEIADIRAIPSPINVTLRMIAKPPMALPSDWEVILEKGPFTKDEERTTLEKAKNGCAIDVIVMRNSGGWERDPKLDIAAEKGVTILMIMPPDLPIGLPVFGHFDEVMKELS